MMQRQKLLRWASVNDAVSIYQFICDVCDLSAMYGTSQNPYGF
jgi:hypothetical protein